MKLSSLIQHLLMAYPAYSAYNLDKELITRNSISASNQRSSYMSGRYGGDYDDQEVDEDMFRGFSNTPLLPSDGSEAAPRKLPITSLNWGQIQMDQGDLRSTTRSIEPAPVYDAPIYAAAPYLDVIGGRTKGRRAQLQNTTMQMMHLLHEGGAGGEPDPTGISVGSISRAYMADQRPATESFFHLSKPYAAASSQGEFMDE